MISHLTTAIMALAIWRKLKNFRHFNRHSIQPQREQPLVHHALLWIGAASGLMFLQSFMLLVCTITGWTRYQFGNQWGCCLAVVLSMPVVSLSIMIEQQHMERVDKAEAAAHSDET